jgi:DNA repair exonuclease SbcCD nuclease subunit
MSKLKGIIADIHCHAWDAFHTTNEDGVNSRLRIILDEIERAGMAVLEAGGNTLIVAGDLFHVRGSIAPSVLNPTSDVFEQLVNEGLEIIIIPGNHDLEGKKSVRISSAVTSLEKVGCHVAEVPTFFESINTLVFPWVEDVQELKKELKSWADIHEDMKKSTDLILHAPIDGVIPGLPAHGLTADWLATLGFKRVFSGHYHNHKDFGNGVYSIGAIAHHSWSDPGSKAGFLLVDDEAVKFNKSHAPEFIDIDASMDEMEIALAVDRNYVRAKINKSKAEDVEKLRDFLTKSGAKGIVINAIREPVRTRTTSTLKAGKSIETSLGEYIAKSEMIDEDMKAEVTARSVAILGETV